MLSLNLIPIFKARAIEKPYSFLVKAGLSPHSATNILNNKTHVFRLDHIELLCRVLICEPNDLLSIKNSVDLAWNAPNDNELRQLVLEKYTWEKAAIETKKAYVQIINP